ncbi:ABC transporter ATP-binding protein [Erysipelothrix aquatica]|uniref:ABC transporter ATP-binding protein n=1 Tax=Erysipelothrix aquatica TaxID=2683714 RepID=UPI0013590F54|nr:ABC transporter ATP-binding protein [Erysipelothrix aquatica]
MKQDSVLMRYLKKKKMLLVVSSIFSIGSTAALFIPYFSVYKIIESLMINEFTRTSLLNWSLLSIGSLLLSMVFLYIASMCSHIAAFDILYEIRMDVVRHLSKVSMGYFTENSSGQMIQTIDQSVEKMESFIAHQIPDIVSAIAYPILYICFVLTIDWRLGLMALAPLVTAIVVYGALVSKTIHQSKVKEFHDAQEAMSNHGVAYITGMPAVKVFGLSVNNFKKFNTSIQNYRNLVIEWTRSYRTGYVIYTSLITAAGLFVMFGGVWFVVDDFQSREIMLKLMLFIILSMGVGAPFMKLMYAVATFTNVMEGVNRIDDILDVKTISDFDTEFVFLDNSIQFEDVSFAYTDSNNVLKHVNFELQPNSLNALVGPSGGGKSTIAQLLLRFYDVGSGCIKVGDTDIRDVSITRLMESISFVFQDVVVFNDTVLENIRMGNKEATEIEIIDAAKRARCHEFIMTLPNAYQTVLGANGVYLSKGEAQRLSIARALLKNAPILVLDEATAYADAENELFIQMALRELVKEKTVLIIAHHLWTIQHVDQIIVCNEGEIEAKGTHDELLENCQLYQKLWLINDETKGWEMKQHA